MISLSVIIVFLLANLYFKGMGQPLAQKSDSPPVRTRSTLLQCSGKIDNNTTYRFSLNNLGLTTLNFQHRGTRYTCRLETQRLSNESPFHNTSILRLQADRSLNCQPKLSTSLHMGLEDNIDIDVRREKTRVAYIRLFETFPPLKCSRFKLNMPAFLKLAATYPPESLRPLRKTKRPIRPLPEARTYFTKNPRK